ncbi:MAG: rhomboid family intramembrane serine protease [Bacteroidetes bacterium]|nr:rhomboid family intramembrane serine protease [Bacteroidota bacterium]
MNYQQFRPTGFNILPPVVKNLLIINGLFFLGTITFQNVFHTDLSKHLGLHYFESEQFNPFQLVTYMFMHGGMSHIFFNMFALWMFGKTLEEVWGPKRFLTYYMVTGIGAALIQMLVTFIRIQSIEAALSPDLIDIVYREGSSVIQQGMNYSNDAMAKLNAMINTPTVGASGAVFGLLLAFGMLFPNAVIYLYFAIPIKAKWFVMIYGAIELYSGVANNPADNVAHFAHLGGMIFGFFLIKYWKRN